MIPDIIRNYEFIFTGEMLRGIFVTVVAQVAQVIYTTDFATITDWPKWLTSLAIGAGTVALGYVAGKVPKATTNPLPPSNPGAPV